MNESGDNLLMRAIGQIRRESFAAGVGCGLVIAEGAIYRGERIPTLEEVTKESFMAPTKHPHDSRDGMFPVEPERQDPPLDRFSR